MTDRSGSFDGVHRRNLARVLGLVHLEGPLSRARLTALTGLNRSTIAALAGELVGLGLVEERAPDPTNRVGRPSPVVAPDPRIVAIAVNPEVDAVTVAAVGLGGRIEARERIEVDHLVTPEETARLIADAIARWRAGELAHARFAGVGLAVPGLVRASDGLVRFAPHLEWRDAPVRAFVEEATGLPTTVGNDASLGAIAEHLFGAGRGVDDLLYLNGGASGIGGGIILGGAAFGGHGGFAGELGQSPAGFADPADRASARGVLEDEVGRDRLLSALGMPSATEPDLAAVLLATDRADIRDELARQRRVLAASLATAVNVLDPELIVLGGYLATLLDSDPEGLRRHVVELAVPGAAGGVRLAAAGLGDDRLLVGAAELAFGTVLADPTSVEWGA